MGKNLESRKTRPVQCGDKVTGKGVALGEVDDCRKITPQFHQTLLDIAEASAQTDAENKCPEGCKEVRLVEVKEIHRLCFRGDVTLIFVGTYECTGVA